MGLRELVRLKSRQLKTELLVVFQAYKHPGVSWYAKAFLAVVIGYALSPIDLIPDFIPVLGYLDDIIIVPLGIYLALKMIPSKVLAECREKALREPIGTREKWVMTTAILFIWALVIYLVVKLVLNIIDR